MKSIFIKTAAITGQNPSGMTRSEFEFLKKKPVMVNLVLGEKIQGKDMPVIVSISDFSCITKSSTLTIRVNEKNFQRLCSWAQDLKRPSYKGQVTLGDFMQVHAEEGVQEESFFMSEAFENSVEKASFSEESIICWGNKFPFVLEY